FDLALEVVRLGDERDRRGAARRERAREAHRVERFVQDAFGGRGALHLAQELQRLGRPAAPQRALEPPARAARAAPGPEHGRRRGELHLLHAAPAVVRDPGEELRGPAHAALPVAASGGCAPTPGAGRRAGRTTTVPATRSWSACRRGVNTWTSRPMPAVNRFKIWAA